MGRSTAVSEKPQTRKGKAQGMRALLSRLQDPKDVQAAAFMAFAILVFEAGICPLIINKIPCEFPHIHQCMHATAAWRYSRASDLKPCSAMTLLVCSADTELDWVAYMQEVEGFMKAMPFDLTHVVTASLSITSLLLLRALQTAPTAERICCDF